METNRMVVSGNVLDIKNPNRVYGCVLFLFGLAIGGILYFRGPQLISMITPLLKRSDNNFTEMVLHLSKYEIMDLAGLIIAIVTGIFAVFRAIIFVLSGIKNIFSFFIPAGIPHQIYNTHENINLLLQNRTITSYEKPSASVRMMSRLFSERFRYVTHNTRVLVEELLGSIKKWVFILCLLCIPHYIPESLFNELPPEWNWLELFATINWPVPIYLIGIGAYLIIIRLLAALCSIPSVPSVDIHESREHITNSGNPIDFYHYLQNHLIHLRYKNFPNRMLFDKSPLIGKIHQGEADKYQSRLMLETQPIPIARGISMNSLLLCLGGSLLMIAGYILLLYPDLNQLPDDVVSEIFRLLAGLTGLNTGRALIRRGHSLTNVFRFKSFLFDLQMRGTFGVSRIGLGDGRGGQFHTERLAVQSDTHIEIKGAEIITECHGLNNQRIIVDTWQSKDFDQALKYIIDSIYTYKDSQVDLVKVNLEDPNTYNLINANAAIMSLTSQAQSRLQNSNLMAMTDQNSPNNCQLHQGSEM